MTPSCSKDSLHGYQYLPAEVDEEADVAILRQGSHQTSLTGQSGAETGAETGEQVVVENNSGHSFSAEVYPLEKGPKGSPGSGWRTMAAGYLKDWQHGFLDVEVEEEADFAVEEGQGSQHDLG